jgi:uncharacterized protein YbjT (DUF2867 family)
VGSAATAAAVRVAWGSVTAGQHVLVLGATGYVGGRLVPRLIAAGHRVRCLARDPAKLRDAPWAGQVEIVRGDLLEGADGAFAGIDTVYHLVHSMSGGADFARLDRAIARSVATSAAQAGVGRIVYLGGLAGDEATSEHMRSRAEVADVLRTGPVPVTELRAAVIIGSGSASFEMLRHLVEVLPVMVTPRWVESRVQPIAIRDVLRYLIGVLAIDDRDDHTFDIGGPDVLTYRQMMRIYAEVAGLPRRIIVPVPPLTPRLSSHWVGVVTPVPAAIARPLVESLTTDAVAVGGTEAIQRLVPGERIGYRRALQLALARVRDHDVETSWREADYTGRPPAEPDPSDPDWTGGTLYRDRRTATAHAPPADLFAAVCGIGGDRGWPHAWAWRIRGILDRMVGGIGLRRGRRDPDALRVGDALDFWRVLDVRAPRDGRPGLLRLVAEMKLPGRAWLEFHVGEGDEGTSVLHQQALYAPRGLFGRLYWWVLVPFHHVIFPDMAARLVRRAEQRATSSGALTAPPAAPGDPAAATAPDQPPARRAG